MKTSLLKCLTLAVALGFGALSPCQTAAQTISYTSGTITENFDSMGPMGTNTPPGWFVGYAGPTSLTNVVPNDGSIAPNQTAGWNLGSSAATDRAPGTMATSTGTPTPPAASRFVEARILNNSGQSLSNITVFYDGEQWRTGSSTTDTNNLALQFSSDGVSFVNLGDAFDFTQPTFTPVNSALDGNLAANRATNRGGAFVLPSPLPPGGTLFLRWFDFNNNGTEPAMAIDNFSFSATLASQAPGTVTGLWNFDQGDLRATIGLPLEYRGGTNGPTVALSRFGTTTALGLPDIAGAPANVMCFDGATNPAIGFLMRHLIPPNGGGTNVNQWTLLMDVLFPHLNNETWFSFVQIDDPTDNANDGDLFAQWNGGTAGIGISSQYAGQLHSNQWHRVAFAVRMDGASPVISKFIDGVKVADQTNGLPAPALDGRFTLRPTVLLFGDEDAESQPVYVNSVQIRSGKTSDADIAALGAPSADGIPIRPELQLTNVLSPSDPIILVNGMNDGDANAGPPPATEGVEHAIDRVTQKYLNFLDLGSGFIVTPSVGSTMVTGIRLYTANDEESRDPASYLLEGSNSGTNGPWTVVSSNSLSLPSGRNPGGGIATDPSVHFNQTLIFDNGISYTSYRVTFPTLKDAAAANSMQIAEVELLGTLLTPPFCERLFSDNTFNNNDWIQTVFTCNAGGSSTVNQPATAGCDGGPYRRITHVLNSASGGDSGIFGIHIRNGTTHDPATQGALRTIDYSECNILFSGGGNGHGTGPALKQGGKYYIVSLAKQGVTPQSTWAAFSLAGLNATDFVTVDCAQPNFRDATQHPNFCGGGPIEFGFFRANSTPGPPNTLIGGIDNWRVQLHCYQICGQKFRDLNGNGVKDTGEPGLPSWTIIASGPMNATAITDANGNYCLSGLRCGTYVVSEVLQPAWVQTMPPAPGTYTVTVGPGLNPGPVIFGNKQCPPPEPCNVTPGPGYSADFNSGAPAGMTFYGNATVAAGALKLTQPPFLSGIGQVGMAKLPPLPGQTYIHAFRATFKLYIGGGTGADGFSFNLADDSSIAFPGPLEEGVGTGLTVEFDTFSNGAGDPTGIFLKSGGPPTTPINGTVFQPSQGPSVTAPGWKQAQVEMDSCGYVKVTYDGILRVAGYVSYIPGPTARFALAARTGVLTDNHWVDDLVITTESNEPDITAVAPPGACCAVVTYSQPCFRDLCSPISSPACMPPSACFPVGVSRVCCTTKDAVGQEGHSGFYVIVKDQNLPSVSCTGIAPKTDFGCIGFVPNYLPAFQASDLCWPASQLVLTQSPPPGTAVVPGVTTVTLTACNPSGNCASCTTTYTVVGSSSCVCGPPPPPGLVLWMPFDEPNTFPNSVAHNTAGGNNGFHQGPPTVNPFGYVDRSLCFDGANQYVQVPYYSAIDVTTGDFSIDAWVKLDAGGDTGLRMIVDHRANFLGLPPPPPRGYALFLFNGVLGFQMLDANGNNITQAGHTVPLDNAWHFVAVTVKRNDLAGGRLYMDNLAPVVFSTTPAPGTLANGRGVNIGASTFGFFLSDVFKGCIDEVEIFNRELTPASVVQAEATRIFLAGQRGKCKLSCSLPNVGFCSGDQSVTVSATFCNNTAYPETYTYGLAGLLPGCGPLSGWLTFSGVPATTGVVWPWTCKTITFTVPRPPGLAGNAWGCIELLAWANTSGKTIRCQSLVYDASTIPWNCINRDWSSRRLMLAETNSGDRGHFSSGPIEVVNPSETNRTLNYRIRVQGQDMQDDMEVISLNGQQPGTIITNTVALAPGGSTTIAFDGLYLMDDPNQTYLVLIEGRESDTDAWARLGELPVTEFFQSRLAVIMQPVGGHLQPAVSWSSYGTLQCAPTLGGPWTDLPDATNPYVIPVDGDPARFYRVKQ